MTQDEIEKITAPIEVAYNKLEKAEKGVLSYAIKLGAELNLAKDKVEKAGEKWEPWVEINLKDMFSHRSASDYMLLARYPDLSQHAASIRDALRKIAEKQKAEGTARTRTPRTPKPDLTSQLQNMAPNEVRATLTARGRERGIAILRRRASGAPTTSRSWRGIE
jgi:hypothetical protein